MLRSFMLRLKLPCCLLNFHFFFQRCLFFFSKKNSTFTLYCISHLVMSCVCKQKYFSSFFMSADLSVSSPCGITLWHPYTQLAFRINNFSLKTIRPRDMLLLLKDTFSIKDDKSFTACRCVCLSVPQSCYKRGIPPKV